MENKTIKNFTDLHAWKAAHTCLLQTYQLTRTFPSNERFGLTSQMRRAAVSVSSNIAEGFGRRSNKEKKQFYYIAGGSVAELQSQLLAARDLKYASIDDCRSLIEQAVRTHRLINGLISFVS
jgi:four helix bundle protein